jgi:hypothetical protein
MIFIHKNIFPISNLKRFLLEILFKGTTSEFPRNAIFLDKATYPAKNTLKCFAKIFFFGSIKKLN